MSATLEALPAELLGEIAKYLFDDDEGDLRPFRLTCRAVHAKTESQFGACYFNHISVDVTFAGLLITRQISRHHQFKDQVRSINLAFDPVVDIYAISDRSSDAEIKWTDLLSSPHGDAEDIMDLSPDSPLAESPLAESEDDTAYLLRPSVVEYVQSGAFGSDFKMLVKDFRNLDELMVSPPHVPNYLTPSQSVTVKNARSIVVSSALSAILENDIHLKAFEISNPWGTEGMPDFWALSSISKTPEIFDSSKLLSLQFNVAETKLSDPSVIALARALQHAKALTYLGLSFDMSPSTGEFFREVTRNIESFPNLQELSLRNLFTSSESLTKVISTSKATLRMVVLNDMVLNSGSWRDVFLYLLNELSLDRIWFENLFEGNQEVSFGAIHVERPIIKDHWWYGETYPPPTEEEIEVLKTYHFITWKPVGDNYMRLEDGDGEDIREWISMMANKYELVDP